MGSKGTDGAKRQRRVRPAHPADLTVAAPRIGLVLGGGAVRGAAHIGALQALADIGFVPDLVCGTSIGALIGAAYAADVPMAKVREAFSDLRWKDLTRLSLRRGLGVFDTSPLRRLVERIIGDIAFDDLRVDFAAVACDVVSGKRVVLTGGSVVDAAMASSALPGLFVPYGSGDALLVDGGVVDNLPVGVARSLGADYVVAIDVVPQRHVVRRPEDLRDMLLTSFEILQQAMESEAGLADCYIAPPVSGFSMADFSVVGELERRGYEAVMEAAPQLRRDLGLPETPVTPGTPGARP